mmetsp:Transcript_10816/g.32165  ORF Transcript_10816/g.32165 Transcript_10816/m.32165 type:complete len:219 (+) Transcript_10816:535-1191(+)
MKDSWAKATPLPTSSFSCGRLWNWYMFSNRVKLLKFLCRKNFGQTSAAKRAGSRTNKTLPSRDQPMTTGSQTRSSVKSVRTKPATSAGGSMSTAEPALATGVGGAGSGAASGGGAARGCRSADCSSAAAQSSSRRQSSSASASSGWLSKLGSTVAMLLLETKFEVGAWQQKHAIPPGFLGAGSKERVAQSVLRELRATAVHWRRARTARVSAVGLCFP